LGYLKQFEGVEATSDQEIIADQTIESTSRFESMTDSRVAWDDIDKKQAHDILARLEPDLDNTERSIQAAAIRQVLVWSDGDRL